MRGRVPTLVPRDETERRVIETWRSGGLRNSSITVYLSWVRRYRAHCSHQGIDEFESLTLPRVVAFAAAYSGPRRGKRVKGSTRYEARNALHAWSCALKLVGVAVPTWSPPSPAAIRHSPLLEEYANYRCSHRGIAARTLRQDVKLAEGFVESLKHRSRRLDRIRVADIDDFVDGLTKRFSRRTVASLCSSLRCFLRFLRVTGRLHKDLASCVEAPRYRTDEHPPRALAWQSVQRIVAAIPREQRRGRRDYAMVLLLVTYGLGAGELVRLRLDDIDWQAGVLRVRRPKTDVAIELPLLPAVAQVLADYLRHSRPADTPTREVFVTIGLPHRPLTTSAVRHQVRKYASLAGVTTSPLGARVFRHSHATRQVDSGVSAKLVGDILGHRRPSSTSVYVRVALKRLRCVALPVPQ